MKKSMLGARVPLVVASIFIAIILCVFHISRVAINHTLEKNIEIEFNSVLSVQSSVIEHKMQNEVKLLDEIAKSVGSGMDFHDDVYRETLLNIVECRELCMLATVDLEGNVTNYLGENMGNIADREYFYQIKNGNVLQYIQYLKKPTGTDMAKIIISTGIYQNGALSGIIFCSKDIDVLQEIIFNDDFFSGYGWVGVFDNEGQLIVDNNNRNFDINLINSEDEILKFDANQYYVKERKLDDINWSIACVVDRSAPVEAFQNIKNLIMSLLGLVLLLSIAIFIFLMVTNRIIGNKVRKEKQWFEVHYKNGMQVLETMKCALVEYEIKTDHVESTPYFDEKFHCNLLHGDSSAFRQLSKEHPEISYEDLNDGIQSAISTREPSNLDTFMNIDGTVVWLSMVFIPVFNVDNEVSGIVAAIYDTTKQHKEVVEALSLFEKIPGGFHKCYLNDPVHIEYASDGLLSLLGYSREEFEEVIGLEEDYAQCILESDREAFEAFVDGFTNEEKTDSCTYHLLRKDGETVLVSDTMESKYADNGIMHGYSVLTDVSEYNKKYQTLEKELEQTRETLSQTRVRISASQMQPHFLYNALSSIREIVIENPEYAADLIFDFTVYLRACIKSMTNDDLIPLTQEIENIRAYSEIEKMRLGDKLKIRFDIADSDFCVIPLGVQPIVENSIRHGIYPKGAAGGTVTIRTLREENHRIIEVIDDGVGFDVTQMRYEIATGKRDSTGLNNINYRFWTIMHATITIESKIGIGTTTRIIIPQGDENSDEDNNC